MISLRRGIIVSCQALKDEPLNGSRIMARMALAAKMGGAIGIRANTPEDIKAIKEVVDLPVIGIFKDKISGFETYITPTANHVAKVINARADLVAIDCTRRRHPQDLKEIFSYIRVHYPHTPIVADIADLEDALLISELHPNFIATTLSGYTDYSNDSPKPNIALVREIHRNLDIPIIAEGNYIYPEQAIKALVAGAFAVVVGGAITRPQETTKRFTDAIKGFVEDDKKAMGIDLGGTHTRGGIIDASGRLIEDMMIETNTHSPLESVKRVIDRLFSDDISAIGVGAAGRVDFTSGKVLYATKNLHNWSGVKIKDILGERYSIPIVVDNDVNAAAYAQWFVEKGRFKNIFYVAIGTGLGGGMILNGRLYRGKYGNAGEIGHIVIPGNSRQCTCGKRGCLETVLSGRFIQSEYEKRFGNFSWQDFLNRVNSNNSWVLGLIDKMAMYAAWLVDILVNFTDIERVYFGGIVENFGQIFMDRLKRKLKEYDNESGIYNEDVVSLSSFGEKATIIGAALEALHYGEG
ncbi:MAG: hypothetical protein DRP50_02680 [Thermotoga sp.]|nr:MAG: hypothetical protein DRP50_02680 [Thermotoga sp.]